MQGTQVQSLRQEDPQEREMATHSSTLAWRIPWREEPGGLQSTGSQRVGHDWATSLSLSYIYVLVMDRGAWRAAVHGIAKSQTRLSDWTETETERAIKKKLEYHFRHELNFI